MAKVTLVFAILLVALGLAGYLAIPSAHSMGLVCAVFGLALGIFGFLAISPSESRRKLFMHINSTIGVIGLLVGLVSALQSYGNARSGGVDPDMKAIAYKLVMAFLMLVYVNLCVRSFLNARRSREG